MSARARGPERRGEGARSSESPGCEAARGARNREGARARNREGTRARARESPGRGARNRGGANPQGLGARNRERATSNLGQ